MAKSESKGTTIHTWVSPSFAAEVRELAEQDGRSVSNLIRHVLQAQLETSPISSVGEGGPARHGGQLPRHRRGATASEEPPV